MKTNVNFERLLEKSSQLETMEQTPQVLLLRRKLPNMVERYQKMNQLEENLNALLLSYQDLMDQANQGLEEIEGELSALIPDK